MAIKFSTKDQPAAPIAAKPVKAAPVAKAAGQPGEEAATDLFKSPAATKAKSAKKK
jgi:hypothetical protein